MIKSEMGNSPKQWQISPPARWGPAWAPSEAWCDASSSPTGRPHSRCCPLFLLNPLQLQSTLFLVFSLRKPTFPPPHNTSSNFSDDTWTFYKKKKRGRQKQKKKKKVPLKTPPLTDQSRRSTPPQRGKELTVRWTAPNPHPKCHLHKKVKTN